jgi:2-phosphoglycerate kinase
MVIVEIGGSASVGKSTAALQVADVLNLDHVCVDPDDCL